MLESLGRSPQRAAQSFAAEIRTRLEWRTATWEPLIGELCVRRVSAGTPGWRRTSTVPGDHGELTRVQRGLDRKDSRRLWKRRRRC